MQTSDTVSAELQKKIKTKYSTKAITAAKKRLCKFCTDFKEHEMNIPHHLDELGNIVYVRVVTKCDLIPITSKGEDCPYFRRSTK